MESSTIQNQSSKYVREIAIFVKRASKLNIQCFSILICITCVVAGDNDFAEKRIMAVYRPRSTRFNLQNVSKCGDLRQS